MQKGSLRVWRTSSISRRYVGQVPVIQENDININRYIRQSFTINDSINPIRNWFFSNIYKYLQTVSLRTLWRERWIPGSLAKWRNLQPTDPSSPQVMLHNAIQGGMLQNLRWTQDTSIQRWVLRWADQSSLFFTPPFDIKNDSCLIWLRIRSQLVKKGLYLQMNRFRILELTVIKNNISCDT